MDVYMKRQAPDRHDKLTSAQRSSNMAAVRSRGNLTTEIAVGRLLTQSGCRGYRKHWKTIGHPDFAWPSRKIALFVDGCFWHGCPKCYTAPKANHGFWAKKLAVNQERDRNVNSALRAAGWTVIRVWECGIYGRGFIRRVRSLLVT